MSSLIFLTGQLAKRREQLIRLKSAAIQLEAVYEKFITKQKKITEPTLHRKLWYGELASETVKTIVDTDISLAKLITSGERKQ